MTFIGVASFVALVGAIAVVGLATAYLGAQVREVAGEKGRIHTARCSKDWRTCCLSMTTSLLSRWMSCPRAVASATEPLWCRDSSLALDGDGIAAAEDTEAVDAREAGGELANDCIEAGEAADASGVPGASCESAKK